MGQLNVEQMQKDIQQTRAEIIQKRAEVEAANAKLPTLEQELAKQNQISITEIPAPVYVPEPLPIPVYLIAGFNVFVLVVLVVGALTGNGGFTGHRRLR